MPCLSSLVLHHFHLHTPLCAVLPRAWSHAGDGQALPPFLSSVQLRLYDPRAGVLAKGTFTPDSQLPPNTIVVRSSQVKLPHQVGARQLQERVSAHSESSGLGLGRAGRDDGWVVARLEVRNWSRGWAVVWVGVFVEVLQGGGGTTSRCLI